MTHYDAALFVSHVTTRRPDMSNFGCVSSFSHGSCFHGYLPHCASWRTFLGVDSTTFGLRGSTSRACSPHIGHFFSPRPQNWSYAFTSLSLIPAQLDGPPAHQSRHFHRDGRKHIAALPHETTMVTNMFSLERSEPRMSSIRSISFVFSYACCRLS